MSDTSGFTIGSAVECSDGPCGEVNRLIIDPHENALTHLVVEPKHHKHKGRLVPIELVASSAGHIRLSCTKAQFEALEDAEESQFRLGADGPTGYAPVQADPINYSLRLDGTSYGGFSAIGSTAGDPKAVKRDRVPRGEVEIKHGDKVEASDGEVGSIEGLVIDQTDHHVTHVLLAEGHLWGAKTVAIPMSAIDHINNVVWVKLSKDEIRDLPSVEVDRTG